MTHAAASPVEWHELHGARWAFTTAAQGNLALHVGDDPVAVRQRRARIAAEAGCESFEFMDQYHSDVVAHVPPRAARQSQDSGPQTAAAGEAPAAAQAASAGLESAAQRDAVRADAMVSRSVPLAVLVADCVPVVFVAHGPQGAVAVGVAHAGREGLLSGILERTVEALRAEAPGAGIAAVVGPSICGECYEVPEEMAAAGEARSPGVRSATRRGTPSLDLPGRARAILESLDVDAHVVGACTLEDERYPSHRRDPGAGRLAGLVIPPDSVSPGAAHVGEEAA
ncbi:polyphenol oxidase family protein [Falsarthrobacter nasiphocae]|uniref:YfiH family protein n=1 Tax=Falsarthrobacter nasiphocae TaxID=189863 RepID=A0AAE3YDC2_9MICC|nr:polyphenol oxidase family protein [Falsarthrobacter nasiphocae]MDR6891314.1 YfiH family protein [Falsarthrobacter nasiphocae]